MLSIIKKGGATVWRTITTTTTTTSPTSLNLLGSPTQAFKHEDHFSPVLAMKMMFNHASQPINGIIERLSTSQGCTDFSERKNHWVQRKAQ